ncbi:hypothetical protein AB0M79_28605 [Polymorphospora sp. NPDC051019]|uniref:hypothetical protein n=1 Tax=Polymorphospora sp. NPDC051019 TaxID=3155725 RepID=UPI00342CD7BE
MTETPTTELQALRDDQNPVTEPAPPQAGIEAARAAESAAAELRNAVADRWRKMAALYAMHALDRRTRDPISPNACAFFYREPTGRIRIASRLLLAGPEADDLVPLLHRLTTIVTRHGAGYDPRVAMSNRAERMDAKSTWLGLAVSTLDTPARAWVQTGEVGTSLEVPVRGFVRLADGTRILVGLADSRLTIAATQGLSVAGQVYRPWHWSPDLTHDPDTRPVWEAVDRLHDTIRRHHP